MTCALTYLTDAVAALGDRHAAEIKLCEQVLKLESEVGRRRAAEPRLFSLTDPTSTRLSSQKGNIDAHL